MTRASGRAGREPSSRCARGDDMRRVLDDADDRGPALVPSSREAAEQELRGPARSQNPGEDERYQKRLNDNLMTRPDSEGKFEQLRSTSARPKNDGAGRRSSCLPSSLAGKFDLADSFLDAAKQESLHVLARVKQRSHNQERRSRRSPPTRASSTPTSWRSSTASTGP